MSLRRDPEKMREWQERSRRKAAENARAKPRKPLARGKPLERKPMKRKPPKPKSRAGYAAFKEAAREQRCCQAEGCENPGAPWDPHHVIELQFLEREGLPRYAPENALRLCRNCHRLHTLRHRTLPLRCLTSGNLLYAVDLLGPGRAENYLRRHYAGDDPRLDDLLKDGHG